MSQERLGPVGPPSITLSAILRDELRLLFFRPLSPAIRQHRGAFLAFGLFCTWAAGIGRYWDNPRAEPWQLFGLGSVGYVFTLALVVWLLLAPLRPRHWSYVNVLVFVTLTAPPALLYAIPVEKFLPTEVAGAVNVWFLAVVACWRVALFVAFLMRVARLDVLSVIVGTLTPLVVIIVALSVLNLEHVVFDIMRSARPEQRTANDAAYEVVFLLSMLSILAAPVLLIGYLALCVRAARRARAMRRGDGSVSP